MGNSNMLTERNIVYLIKIFLSVYMLLPSIFLIFITIKSAPFKYKVTVLQMLRRCITRSNYHFIKSSRPSGWYC
jgi:NADH:ubiquinone oxidoreductase subunit K